MNPIGSKLSLRPRLTNLALGLGIISYLLYGIGLSGNLTASVIATAILILTVISFRKIIAVPRLILTQLRLWKRELRTDTAIITLIIIFFAGLYTISALAPAIKFDDTWYHLTEVKTYLSEQKIRPFLPPAQLGQSSITPRLIDILYILPLAINSSSSVGPKLVHLGLGLLTALAIGAMTRQMFSSRAGHIATLMFITVPIVGWLTQTAYIDLGVAYFGAVAFWQYYNWKKNGDNPGILGVLLGFFMATKLWASGFVLILLVDSIISQKPLKEIIKVYLIAFLILAPWLIEAYLATGNPIFPLFSGGDQSEFLGGARFVGDWLTRVYWIKLFPALGAIAIKSVPWLAFMPLAVFAQVRQRKTLIWLIVLGIFMIAGWAVIPWRDDRFLIPFAIPSLVAVAASLDFFLSRSKIVYLGAAVPTLLLLFFLLIAPLRRAVFYYPVVSAQVSKESFLHENVSKNIWSCWDTSGRVKKEVGTGKALVMCHNMFYLDFSYRDAFDIVPKINFNSGDELVEKLKGLGFTHLLTKGPVYSLDGFFDLVKIRYIITKDWTKYHFNQIYSNQENGLTLYEIK